MDTPESTTPEGEMCACRGGQPDCKTCGGYGRLPEIPDIDQLPFDSIF